MLPVTVGNDVASSPPPPQAASEAARRAAATSANRRRTVVSYFLIERCGTGTGRPCGVAPAARSGQLTCTESPTRLPAWLHACDELLDPVVDGTERVLAEDCALRLIVQFEMHPIDGEVPPAFLVATEDP